jgi:hypothetical protein
LLWVWLYRIWPRALNVMVLMKPATVVQWHRKGFRLYWRWRSTPRSPGRPKMCSATRDLVRQMCLANPLWGTPPHPRRTAQARHHNQPSHCRPIHTIATQNPLPDLAFLSSQTHERLGRHRHVRCSNRNVSTSLCPDRPWP